MVSEPAASLRGRQPRPGGARHVAGSRRWPRPRPRDGFGHLVGWTTLGAIVPGAGLVAAGARRAGWTLVALFAATLVALGILLLTGDVVSIGPSLATRPDALLAVAAAVLAVTAAWCALILVTHLLLRRGRLSTPQRVLSGLLVAALMGLVAVPSATAARYAMTQRSLILTVFDEPEEDDEEARPDGLAGPDVEARDPWEDTPRVNVLLLGSDAGENRVGTRPDTIIVASIDTRTGDTLLLSLPRNLERVPFPEGSPAAEQFPDGFWCENHGCLLNGVWSWAEANAHLFPGAEEPGLAATRQVVSEALGVPIDYYAQVNLQGFAEVINALGGVELTVERRLPIGGGFNELTGRSNPVSRYIEPGRQVLDGYHALWYARSREGSTDYDRMERQRCLLAAAAEQAQPARLARAFPSLAASAERNVETDIRMSELPAFVELGRRVQDGTIRSLPFTRDVIVPEDPDYDRIRALVREALAPPEPEPAPTASPTPSITAVPPPGEEAGQEPPADPQEAVDVDQVCG